MGNAAYREFRVAGKINVFTIFQNFYTKAVAPNPSQEGNLLCSSMRGVLFPSWAYSMHTNLGGLVVKGFQTPGVSEDNRGLTCPNTPVVERSESPGVFPPPFPKHLCA